MSDVKCEDCKNYINEWCEEIKDCPYPDMPRNCEYFAEKKRFNYGQRVHDKVTGLCGKVTGCVRYYGMRPEQYLVESIDATGRPIEQWVEENRLEKGTPM